MKMPSLKLLSTRLKGIHWQFYKLVLKVPSGRDENDGIGHFAELGSSWPGEAKTWPKIALRVGGRAEKYCVGGRAADMVIIVAGENVGAGIDSWLEETL